MHDFVLGKSVPVKVDGNVVELLSLSASPQQREQQQRGKTDEDSMAATAAVAKELAAPARHRQAPAPAKAPSVVQQAPAARATTTSTTTATTTTPTPTSTTDNIKENKNSTSFFAQRNRNPYNNSHNSVAAAAAVAGTVAASAKDPRACTIPTTTTTTTTIPHVATTATTATATATSTTATPTAALHPPSPPRQSPARNCISEAPPVRNKPHHVVPEPTAVSRNIDPPPHSNPNTSASLPQVQLQQLAPTARRNPSPPSVPQSQLQQQQQQLQNKKQKDDKLLKHTPFTMAKAQCYSPGPVPLDPETAKTWIYPEHPNYPIRQYQIEITETALQHNTIVSLPTGLGKTLIAAVVMYNYYRWFPTTGKVIFLAPTLPLVNQQVQACYKIMGIPASATAILTGKLSPQQRLEWWQSRRVFYCTPQTVQKDLASEHAATFASNIVCIVLDEAHKATGDYAYVKVVEQLEEAGAKFRIVGLSATPGTTIKAIQQVTQALRAAKIEARHESDPSVAPYVHDTHSEIVLVPKNDSQKKVERQLSHMVAPILERLRAEGAIRLAGNATLTAFSIFNARQDFTKRGGNVGPLFGHFQAAYKLIELRTDAHQSLGVVKTKLLRLKSIPQRGLLSTLIKSNDFSELMQTVLEATGTTTTNPSSSQGVRVGSSSSHQQPTSRNNPKLVKLCELLLEHFRRAEASDKSSRAIVFSQFRDSVSEIVGFLRTMEPLIRPRHFVGQGKPPKGGVEGDTTTRLSGMKQAEQHQAILHFRQNVFNVLVCTCIGEEGLDIGEVDLIINYDTLRSPIRMIQRTGRTGRQRDGRVVCLIAEGQEERTYLQSKQAEKTLMRALAKKSNFTMTPSAPMFPNNQPPEQVLQAMRPQSQLHMSQVAGGHSRKTSATNKASSTGTSTKWQLDASQEQERRTRLGALITLEDHEVAWRTLRRVLIRGRSTRSTLGGRTASMLKALERFGPTSTAKGKMRGNAKIQTVFPFDYEPAEEQCILVPAPINPANNKEARPSIAVSRPMPTTNRPKETPRPASEPANAGSSEPPKGPQDTTTTSDSIARITTSAHHRVTKNPYAPKSRANESGSARNAPKNALPPDEPRPANTDNPFHAAGVPNQEPRVQQHGPRSTTNDANNPFLAPPPPQPAEPNRRLEIMLPAQASVLLAEENRAPQLETAIRAIPTLASEELGPLETSVLPTTDENRSLQSDILTMAQHGAEESARSQQLPESGPVVFRLPTPPPSSSSSDDEEGDDEQSLSAKEDLLEEPAANCMMNEVAAEKPAEADIGSNFVPTSMVDRAKKVDVSLNPPFQPLEENLQLETAAFPTMEENGPPPFGMMARVMIPTLANGTEESARSQMPEGGPVVFRLPTPPPSSSSEDEEDEEGDDEQSLTAKVGRLEPVANCMMNEGDAEKPAQSAIGLDFNPPPAVADRAEADVAFRLQTQESSSSEDEDSSDDESRPQQVSTPKVQKSADDESSPQQVSTPQEKKSAGRAISPPQMTTPREHESNGGKSSLPQLATPKVQRVPGVDSSSEDDMPLISLKTGGGKKKRRKSTSESPKSGSKTPARKKSSDEEDLPLSSLKKRRRSGQNHPSKNNVCTENCDDEQDILLISLKKKRQSRAPKSPVAKKSSRQILASDSNRLSEEVTPKSLGVESPDSIFALQSSTSLLDSQGAEVQPSTLSNEGCPQRHIGESPDSTTAVAHDIASTAPSPSLLDSPNDQTGTDSPQKGLPNVAKADYQEATNVNVIIAKPSKRQFATETPLQSSVSSGGLEEMVVMGEENTPPPPVVVRGNSRKRKHVMSDSEFRSSQEGLDQEHTVDETPCLRSTKSRVDLLEDTSDETVARLYTGELEAAVDETPRPRSSKPRVDLFADTPDETVTRLKAGGRARCRSLSGVTPQHNRMSLTDTPLKGELVKASRGIDPEDIFCAVCLSSDSVEDDPIVLCDGVCNLGFHQSCYSITVDFDSDEPWFCDNCHFRVVHNDAASETTCTICSKKQGPVRNISELGWCHPVCAPFAEQVTSKSCVACTREGAVRCFSCTAAVHPHCAIEESSVGLWTLVWVESSVLVRKSSLFCPNHTNNVNNFLSIHAEGSGGEALPKIKVIQTRRPTKTLNRSRMKQLKKSSVGKNADAPLEQEVVKLDEVEQDESVAKLERLKRRRQVLSRFVLEEADVGSDEDVDGDCDENEELRRLEDQANSQDSFINDNFELTQHFSQDDLAKVDPDASAASNFQHRALDAQKERDNQFKTPLFNRRMKNREDSQFSFSSEKGLGNMNFIRSVLEHHRQGGGCEEIEEFYHQVAQEEAQRDQSPAQAAAVPPRQPKIVMVYASSDDEHSGDKPNSTENPPTATTEAARPPQAAAVLTAEQRERIEMNRLAALRRKQQRDAGMK
jgi:ERCC4-related helicase